MLSTEYFCSQILLFLNTHNIHIQHSQYLSFNQVDTHFIRFDAIHPIISGNKWFKLQHYIQEAIALKAKYIVTFGGAFSNHIIATAKYAADNQLQSIGIIRGEQVQNLSSTLQAAQQFGMQLFFVSREAYKHKVKLINTLPIPTNSYIIHEGGFGKLGATGVENMYQYIPTNTFSHIVCACGTGTTMAGLINGSRNETIEGIVVLKGYEKIVHDIHPFTTNKNVVFNFHHQFHCGGYAKYSNELIDCMNQLYTIDGIATDFVYTGKMVYAIKSLIEQAYFSPNAKLLLIHSGGLQGNAGLPQKTLCF
jgi:1-aminocyclopropane-1-carboxylate deaminase